MNVLFLPENIASIPSLTANALNKINGTQAKNIASSYQKFHFVSDTTIYLPPRSKSRLNFIKFFYTRWKYWKALKKWIEWADVLHYVWGSSFSNGIDLAWAKSKNKTIIIEWVGSDIRNPEILFKINPYYAEAFYKGYEYKELEESDYKNKTQLLFSKAGATLCISPEVSLFLNKKKFPHYHILFQRVNLQDFTPQYPAIENRKPLIVHSPTVPFAKGTNVIIPIIEELKKQYNFDFILLQDMAREKVLEIMQKADIFLDQIIFGGYGMACAEAMSFGKPVMCYVMPEVFEAGLPKNFPVVNTNPDNLREQLITLINNPQSRHDIGKKSRSFAEEYFDSDKIASNLLNIYKKASALKDKKNV